MATKSSSDKALEILSHLEERRTGFARTLGSMKRKEFAAVQKDVANIIDGKPVEWTAPDSDVEIEDAAE